MSLSFLVKRVGSSAYFGISLFRTPIRSLKYKLSKMTDQELNGANGIESKTPFLIGVAGGTASGKSTVCERIMEKLGQQHKEQTERRVVCISQDSFYRSLTPPERLRAECGQFNFDHPDAFDDKKLLTTLQDILAGKKVEVPVYDYITNSISPNQTHTIYPADVVLIEGILVFYFPEVRRLFHMKLFVDTDSDTRLARRVPRDIMERGRDLEQVLNQYMNFVKPAFEEFCLPTKQFADVIIPRGADNLVAIDLIVHHIWDILYKKRPLVQKAVVNGNCHGGEEETANGRRMSVAIDLIVQHISEYLKRSPREKPALPVDLDYAGFTPSLPSSPQRNAGKTGRPH